MYLVTPEFDDRIRATMRPYRPKTSAKMRIRICPSARDRLDGALRLEATQSPMREIRLDTHHTDEKTTLLGGTSYTGITDDSDGETGGETGKTDGETSTELHETGEERHGGFEGSGDQDGNDETVLSLARVCVVDVSIVGSRLWRRRLDRSERRGGIWEMEQ